MSIAFKTRPGLPLQDPRLMETKETPPKALKSGNEFHQLFSSSPVRLTIWRQSLLFNGNGYTVFDDSNGRMVFRVDNYACNWREETFLMDYAGNVLFTIRRCKKKLSILESSWEAYRGDRDVSGLGDDQKPFLKATKALGNPSCRISVAADDTGGPIHFLMNWSRQKGWSRIYHSTSPALPVAQVDRKWGVAAPEGALGKDVLTLCMEPGMDKAIIMAMVMINDAMR
ncbi:hypothetical protein MRB53_032138 [Persea americana]|uniref:Uncharacterized protein n=1 Tax=Persea americana TaxID=3435 RepID=A0ACC2KRI4_PERAE|nr:hypothetical protein MRB53_032138 [Persea americana]